MQRWNLSVGIQQMKFAPEIEAKFSAEDWAKLTKTLDAFDVKYRHHALSVQRKLNKRKKQKRARCK